MICGDQKELITQWHKDFMMKKKKILSVVTPVYNCNKYIDESIKSVVSQKNDYVEYIIIDGSSTDGTVDTIKKYSSQIDIFISEPDKGQADALNKGIKTAEGKFILWLNGDDELCENVLGIILPILERIDDKTTIYGDTIYIKNGSVREEKGKKKLSYNYLLNINPSIPTNATIYPKRLFKETGYFIEDYHYSFDYELYLRLVKSYKLKYIETPFIKFRIHEDAKSTKDWIKFDLERLKIRRFHGGRMLSKNSLYSLHRSGIYLKVRLLRKLKGI